MESSKVRVGKLVVDYVSGENDYLCVCDCGFRVILTEEQIKRSSHCGCEVRKLLLAAAGASEDDLSLIKDPIANPAAGRGVNFEKSKNKWRARITFQSKEYHLGYFSEESSAIAMRDEAEKHIGYDFIKWYNSI